MRPISSARALSMSARRHITLARSRGFIFCHSEPGSICPRAAFTAASTSPSSAEATSAIFSSVAGLMVANVAPDRASTKSPLMKSLFWMAASVMAPGIVYDSDNASGWLAGDRARPAHRHVAHGPLRHHAAATADLFVSGRAAVRRARRERAADRVPPDRGEDVDVCPKLPTVCGEP